MAKRRRRNNTANNPFPSSGAVSGRRVSEAVVFGSGPAKIPSAVQMLNALGRISGTAGVLAQVVAPFVDRVCSNETERKRTREWLATIAERLARIAAANGDRNHASVERVTLEAVDFVAVCLATLDTEAAQRTPGSELSRVREPRQGEED